MGEIFNYTCELPNPTILSDFNDGTNIEFSLLGDRCDLDIPLIFYTDDQSFGSAHTKNKLAAVGFTLLCLPPSAVLSKHRYAFQSALILHRSRTIGKAVV